MRSLLFFLFWIIAFSSTAQTYSVGQRSITFIDEQRANRSIPADVYYPADASGTNVAVASGVVKFPVVVFGHGFVIGTSSYKWLADSLVKYGYIIAFPSTESGFSPDHLAFAKDLSVVAGKMIAFNDDNTSFLFSRVTPRSAVAGHSMGGGSSFLAAALQNPSVNALFNFAAAETNPSAIAAAGNVTVPSLIFSGSGDCIVPPSVQLNMYNNIPVNYCKAIINITQALHCQFANNNFNCSFGQASSGCNSTALPLQTLFSKMMTALLPFLDYNLKSKCDVGSTFISNVQSLTGVSQQVSCSPLPACGVVANSFQLYGRSEGVLNKLSWNTASGDVHHYLIERSLNGNLFSNIARIENFNQQDFEFSESALNTNNFYRIVAVSSNRTIRRSNTVEIRALKKEFSVHLNGFSSENIYLNIYSDKETDAHMLLYNSIGSVLYRKQIYLFKGAHNYTVPTCIKNSGMYFLKLSANNQSKLIILNH